MEASLGSVHSSVFQSLPLGYDKDRLGGRIFNYDFKKKNLSNLPLKPLDKEKWNLWKHLEVLDSGLFKSWSPVVRWDQNGGQTFPLTIALI